MPLEAGRVVAQVGRGVGQAVVQDGDRLGPVGAGDDVLALGVEQDVAVEGRRTGRGVAGEEHAGRRRRAAVAEDHRLDRDGRPEVVGDAFLAPVGPGAIALPRSEDGLDREAELGPWIGRDVGDADDRAEARLEPFAARPGEGLVPGDPGETGRRRVVEAEVEDRVHHPGHRHGRPGSDADEERVSRVAEVPPDGRLDVTHPLAELVVETGRPAAGQEAAASLRRDHEARRHGQTEVAGHDTEVRRLATQEGSRVRLGQPERRVEGVGVSHGFGRGEVVDRVTAGPPAQPLTRRLPPRRAAPARPVPG